MGLEDAAEPSSLLLEIGGVAPLFGGERALAQEVAQALVQRGLTARLAVADSLGAAWAVAHFYPLPCMGKIRDEEKGSAEHGTRSAERGKLAASPSLPLCVSPSLLVCSACPTPDLPSPTSHFALRTSHSLLRVPRSAFCTCCLLVPPGETAAALAPLPLAALRLPDETLARLAQLGLVRVGDLLRLPRQSLAPRFGPAVLARLDQALGRLDEALVAEQPPAELTSVQHFAAPVERREPLVAALARLLPELAESLAARRLGAAELVCRFVGDRGPPLPLTVSLFQPSAAPRHWLELIELQLEQARFSQPVTAVQVEVTATAPLESPQYELFATGRQAAQPRAVALLVERLSSRLGRAAVVRPRLVADAQPECAAGYLPLAGRAPARPRQLPRASARLPPGERPLWLEARPLPIRVWAVAPEGPPMQFACRGRTHRTVGAWGPERIETAWWRGQSVRRDYYRVETAGGERWWLFRRLNDGAWFLHGRFV